MDLAFLLRIYLHPADAFIFPACIHVRKNELFDIMGRYVFGRRLLAILERMNTGALLGVILAGQNMNISINSGSSRHRT